MVWLRRTRNASAGMRKFFLQFKPNREVEVDCNMAKRNKKSAKASRSGKSPYQKYEKTPYRYSPGYYVWRASVTGKASRHVGP